MLGRTSHRRLGATGVTVALFCLLCSRDAAFSQAQSRVGGSHTMPANGSDYSGILPFTVVDTALLGAIGVVLVVGWVGLRIVTRPGPSA